MEHKEFMSSYMLNYLDLLRESRVTNMWGAVPYIQNQYPKLSDKQAKELLFYWMESFAERREG